MSLFFRQSFIVSDSESNSDDSSNYENTSNESSNAESDKKVSKPGRNSKRSKGKSKDTSSDTDKGRYSFENNQNYSVAPWVTGSFSTRVPLRFEFLIAYSNIIVVTDEFYLNKFCTVS